MRFAVFATLALISSPVIAHDGLRIHPLGADSGFPLALGAAALATSNYVVRK